MKLKPELVYYAIPCLMLALGHLFWWLNQTSVQISAQHMGLVEQIAQLDPRNRYTDELISLQVSKIFGVNVTTKTEQVGANEEHLNLLSHLNPKLVAVDVRNGVFTAHVLTDGTNKASALQVGDSLFGFTLTDVVLNAVVFVAEQTDLATGQQLKLKLFDIPQL